MTEPGKFQFTPPNHAAFWLQGKIEQPQVERLFAQLTAAVSGQPYFFLTIDLVDFKGDTPEARRYSSDRFRELPPRAAAIIADSFMQRTMAKVLFTAIELLAGERRQFTKIMKREDPIEPWFQSMIPTLEAAAQDFKEKQR
jgi:hypothetical protein